MTPNQTNGRRMRASIAPDPKSHCDSRTPITGLVQSRVSVSGGSQSWAEAESDQRMMPTWLCGQDSSGYPSKITKIQTPESDMEEKSLQRSVLFRLEDSSTQRGRYQGSTKFSEELRGLHQHTKKMERQKVRLVYNLIVLANSALS